MPCGWLGRPRHCIYRELPATQNSSLFELTLSEPRCGPRVKGEKFWTEWDSWIAAGLGASSSEGESGQWPVTCPLSPQKKLRLLEMLGSVWGDGERVARHLLLGVPGLPPPGSGKGLGLGGSRPRALPSRRAQASPSDLRCRANPASGAHSGGLSGPSASSGRPAPHTPAPGPSLARPRGGGGTDGGGDWAAPRRVPVSRESARRGECLRGAGRRGLGPPLCAAAPGPHALRRRVQGGGNSAALSRRAPAP